MFFYYINTHVYIYSFLFDKFYIYIYIYILTQQKKSLVFSIKIMFDSDLS